MAPLLRACQERALWTRTTFTALRLVLRGRVWPRLARAVAAEMAQGAMGDILGGRVASFAATRWVLCGGETGDEVRTQTGHGRLLIIWYRREYWLLIGWSHRPRRDVKSNASPDNGHQVSAR
jgi:hypothetical protein